MFAADALAQKGGRDAVVARFQGAEGSEAHDVHDRAPGEFVFLAYRS